PLWRESLPYPQNQRRSTRYTSPSPSVAEGTRERGAGVAARRAIGIAVDGLARRIVDAGAVDGEDVLAVAQRAAPGRRAAARQRGHGLAGNDCRAHAQLHRRLAPATGASHLEDAGFERDRVAEGDCDAFYLGTLRGTVVDDDAADGGYDADGRFGNVGRGDGI